MTSRAKRKPRGLACGQALGVAAACLLLAALDAHGESRTVYRRATPLDARTGIVELRIVDEPVVDVPSDCPGAKSGSFGCRQPHRFPEVYVLDFEVERRESREAETYVELENRGRASLFLEFDPAGRQSFDDELRRALAGLSADAFADSFAGLRPSTGPFSGIAPRSVEPSWSCFEYGTSRQAGRYERHVEKTPDGASRVTGSGWAGYTGEAITRPLCETGDALAGTIRPDEIRTMPLARTLLEVSVEAQFMDGLKRTAYADELAALPPGSVYTIEKAPGVRRSESAHSGGGQVEASYTLDEVKVSASASKTSLDTGAVATNAWLARWTVETVERRMGPLPTDAVVDRSTFDVALLPTRPPVPVGDSSGAAEPDAPETYPVDLDAETFLREVADRLDASATIDARSVPQAITTHPEGMRSRGWLLVVCRADGSAQYWLLPTQAAASVENSDAFCAAVERRLAASGID